MLDISKLSPYQGLGKELKILAKKIPLSVFTNSNASFTHEALKKIGLKDVFDTIITVEDNNFIRKPNPEAYINLFKRLGSLPCELVMFDDIASSLKVLKGFGGHTVLVGNGLREPPYFVDLHTGEEFDKIPSFVDWYGHDITSLVRELNS